jgi:hypothetical protein
MGDNELQNWKTRYVKLRKATTRVIESSKNPKRGGKKNYFFGLFKFASSYGTNYSRRASRRSP